jgi:peptidoglycan/LPS O-acetylase OafA/YrhL
VLVAFTASGYMGVTLFFTLSGFVLGLNYFDRLLHPTPPVLWAYALARFARIAPLYFLVLLFVIVTHLVRGTSIAEWPEHALALQAWDGSLQRAWALNGVAWSVSVEVFLYACLPVLVLVLGRVRSSRAILGTGIGVIASLAVLTFWFVASGGAALPDTDPGSAHRWLYRTPLTRLGDFTLGILAARLYVNMRDRAVAARAGAPIALASAVAIVLLMAWPSHVGTAGSWDVDYAVPSVLLIFGLAIAPSGGLARLLSLPIVVLFGEASYALFMTHRRILNAFDFVPSTGPWTLSAATFELMLAGLAICTAVGLHLLFERPTRRFVRRVGAARGLSRFRTKRPA